MTTLTINNAINAEVGPDVLDRENVLRNPIVSFAAAAFVVVCLFGSIGGERSPAFAWVAAFLFMAVESDVRSLRIPNWLNLAGLLIAFAHAGLLSGWVGIGEAALGAGCAFALLFPFFAIRALGAGDVKALMVLGAALGAVALPALLWWSVLCGGAMGLCLIVVRGGGLDIVRRWGSSIRTLLFTRQWVYIPPAPGSPAATGLPFALAIGLGTAAQQLWGFPWS